MYFRRLKIFLTLIGLIVLVWIGRLAYLQLARADFYRDQARDLLIRPPRIIPTERGRIVDRYNRLLALDVSSYGVAVDFPILAGDARYLAQRGARSKAKMTRDEIEQAAGPPRERYDRLLAEVARTCGVGAEELEARRARIVEQVNLIKRHVSERKGRLTTILEEKLPYTILPDISQEATNKLISQLSGVDGITLAPGQRRNYPWGECLAHLVGLEGPVGPGDVGEGRDPFYDDAQRRYLPGERRGSAGVERSCEGLLRGWRGMIQQDWDDNEIGKIAGVAGQNVELSIDAELQQQIYRVLGKWVKKSDYPTGGAVVVINLGERTIRNGHPLHDGEVLALVSYPSFDPDHWRDLYRQEPDPDDPGRTRLAVADPVGTPALFRAVAGTYPPGSIVKPAVLSGALHDGKVRPDELIDCPGYLIKPEFKGFHCWIWNPRVRVGHGKQTPSDALRNSCNVYFYKVGERLGLTDLTFWLDKFGLGHDQQTGLREETRGTLPTPVWLAGPPRRRGVSPADARNVAIGQGELSITPLAAANMMATVARNGVFLYPMLVHTANLQRQGISLNIDPAYMRIVHDGLFRVVNEPRGSFLTPGTAYDYARMDTTVLAGKTGSAQCSRRKINGQWFPPLKAPKKTKDGQIERDADGAVIIDDVHPAHAWFSGYAPADNPTVAIACLVEYGMSGGKAAGPLAKDVIQICINLDYVPAPTENKREVPGAVEPVTGPEVGG